MSYIHETMSLLHRDGCSLKAVEREPEGARERHSKPPQRIRNRTHYRRQLVICLTCAPSDLGHEPSASLAGKRVLRFLSWVVYCAADNAGCSIISCCVRPTPRPTIQHKNLKAEFKILSANAACMTSAMGTVSGQSFGTVVT